MEEEVYLLERSRAVLDAFTSAYKMPGIYFSRYYQYVHRVITALHSIVHGIRRVRSTSTMILVVLAFFASSSRPCFPFFVAQHVVETHGGTCYGPCSLLLSCAATLLEKNIIDGHRSFREISPACSLSICFVIVLPLDPMYSSRKSVYRAATVPRPRR